MSRFKEYSTEEEKETVGKQLDDIQRKMHEQLDIIHKGPNGSESVRAARIEYDRLEHEYMEVHDGYFNKVARRFIDANKNNPNKISDKILKSAMLTAYLSKGGLDKITPDMPPGVKALIEEGIKPDVMRETIQDDNAILIDYLKDNFPKTYKEVQSSISYIVNNPDNVKNYIGTLEESKILKITPKPIESTAWPKDKVTNRIFSGEMPIPSMEEAFTGDKKGDHSALIQIEYTELLKNNDLILSKSLNEFDRSVYNAITTAFVAKNEYVTLNSLITLIKGTSSARGTKELKESIEKSIKIMNSIRVVITTDHDGNAMCSLPSEKKSWSGLDAVYDRRLLEINSDTKVSINGLVSKKTYHILDEPVLYTYAKIKGQIINRPTKSLNVSNSTHGLNQNKSTISLKGYLIQRIDAMEKSKKPLKNKISYSNIYEITKASNKIETSRARTKVKKILDSFIDNGVIKSYKQTKLGKSIDGVLINL